LIALGIAVLTVAGFLIYQNNSSQDKSQIRSIAVLPFENATGDANNDYLCDGITESLINSLSQIPDIKVIARSSVFRYKGKDIDPEKIASDLGVQALMMGRVVQRENTLDISVDLADPANNTQLWGQHYTRKTSDIFALQDDVAGEIVEKLRLTLSSAERQQIAKRPTENLRAFQFYMQGRAYTSRRTRDDLLTAVRYCERAIEEDSSYALAYAGLADVYAALGVRGYISPQEARRKAEEASRKALALDQNLAEAHAQVGYIATAFAPYNFSTGDPELRRAIELSPSLAIAHQYLALSLEKQGRLDEAATEVIKARELDPLSSIIARQQALPYYLKRDYARAMELLRQANELGPALNTTYEIGIYIQNRSFDEALDEIEKAKQERKDDSILIYSTGMVYAAQGRRAEALQLVKELEAMSRSNLDQAMYIAKIYSTLNEKDMALSWLDRGLAAAAIGSFYAPEPVWDSIRTDPRFADLLRRMGVPT
jgi:TolB-like protein/Flp pilus assembly protein TadD